MNIKGFTLIEIIVVLIVLGVLTSLALPNYFNWIESSRQAEALATIKILREQGKAYMQTHPAVTAVDQSFQVNTGSFDIAQLRTQHFQYIVSINQSNTANRRILVMAIRNCQNGGRPVYSSAGGSTVYNMIWFGEMHDINFQPIGTVGACGYGNYSGLIGEGASCADWLSCFPFADFSVVTSFLASYPGC